MCFVELWLCSIMKAKSHLGLNYVAEYSVYERDQDLSHGQLQVSITRLPNKEHKSPGPR